MNLKTIGEELLEVEFSLKRNNELSENLRKELRNFGGTGFPSKDRKDRLQLSRQLTLLASTNERLLRLRHQLEKDLRRYG